MIGFRGGIDGAVRLGSVRKVKLCNPVCQAKRPRLAGGFEEPHQRFQHSSMRVTGIGIVNHPLAAFLAGVEFFQVPGAVVAEFFVGALDHLAAHRGSPVVLPPPRQRVQRQQPLAERVQIPLKSGFLGSRVHRAGIRIQTDMVRIVEKPLRVLHHCRFDRRRDFETDRILQPQHRIQPPADIVGRPPSSEIRHVIGENRKFPIRQVIVLGIQYPQQVAARQTERLLQSQRLKRPLVVLFPRDINRILAADG